MDHLRHGKEPVEDCVNYLVEPPFNLCIEGTIPAPLSDKVHICIRIGRHVRHHSLTMPRCAISTCCSTIKGKLLDSCRSMIGFSRCQPSCNVFLARPHSLSVFSPVSCSFILNERCDVKIHMLALINIMSRACEKEH